MSGLRERLLRVQGARVPAPGDAPQSAAAPTAPASLADRLRRLAAARAPADRDAGDPARREAAPPRAPNRQAAPDDAALATALGAERLAPGVLRLRRQLPLAVPHGRGSLYPDPAAVRLLSPDAPAEPAAWVVLDTETSGLAGGTGTWVFVVGLARWCGGALEVTQLLLTRLDAEQAFLTQVAAALAGVDLILSYNGKTFDLPLLAARLRLARLPDPMPGIAHLDLLHPVRRCFAGRWPDCRLASVEQRLLGRPRQGDLPGAEAPAAWLDWLRRGDGGRLQAVLGHNRVDLLSVAALPALLAAVYRAPLGFDADPLRIARWRLAAGDTEGARTVLAAVQAAAPGRDVHHLLARLHARAGDWPAALALWERLAEAGDAAAREALAKYFEHRVGDPRRALAHAECLPKSATAVRRQARLRQKLAALTRCHEDCPCGDSIVRIADGVIAAPPPGATYADQRRSRRRPQDDP